VKFSPGIEKVLLEGTLAFVIVAQT
jgi:hypothetical protein